MINTLKSIVNLQGITVMSDIKNWKKLIENIQMNETDEEDANYTDHEVSMAKSQLLSSVKSSTRIAKQLSGDKMLGTPSPVSPLRICSSRYCFG